MAECAAMRNQTLKYRPTAEQALLGGMALASLAAACIWLVLGPAPDIADHLIAIALLIAFFLAALIVMHLTRNTRRQMQAALENRIRAEQAATQALRQSRNYLAEAQRLSHPGSFGWRVATGEIIWSEETFRIFGYGKAPSVTIDRVVQRIHPDDRAGAQQTIDRATRDGKDFDHAYR